MERRTIFPGRLLPILLAAPQLLLTAVFFLWPAGQAAWFSAARQDAFGLRSEFVGFENFSDLLTDPLYRDSVVRTVLFCAAVAALSMGVALLLAVFALAAWGFAVAAGLGGFRLLAALAIVASLAAVQFAGFAFLALQAKRSFEDLFVLGTATYRSFQEGSAP